MASGLVWDERFMWHQNDPTAAFLIPAGGYVQPGQHVENPETKRRIKNLLDASGLSAQMVSIPARMATDEEILTVHDATFLDHLKAQDKAGGSAGMFSLFAAGGFDLIRLAAGGAIEGLDAIISGQVKNAYALIRPCGHHATANAGMGFAFLNNGAIAAHRALETYGLGRVAIFDWDVHHGNGTQSIFWEDPRVLTLSIHQEACFPPEGGWVDEIGAGKGEGYNYNIPLPAGSGHGAYAAAMEDVIVPALRAFKPDLIIIPSGFDAGGFDPLSRQMLSSDAFRQMARQVLDIADELGHGRVLALHEGGYNAYTVPFMALAVIEEMTGIASPVEDPFLPILANAYGQAIKPHQREPIDAARTLLDRFSPRW